MSDIICQVCEAVFEPMTGFEDTKQAYKCSSEVFWRGNFQFVRGFYGSIISDGKIYRVDGKKLDDGPVCDDCLEKMIDNKSLACVSEFNY